jgi:DNA-binding MarR family transcriptional regulator
MKEQYSNILVEFFERMSSWENGVVADRDISLAQMHLLEVVGNHGELRMKELSEKLGVTTGTLTVMVHRLVTKGYLVKEKDADDKRSYFVKLTESGDAEYDNHHHLHGHLIEEIINTLGEDTAESFFQTLKTIQELM